MAHDVLPTPGSTTDPAGQIAIPRILLLRALARYAAAAAAVLATWFVCLVVSSRIEVEPALHEQALFLHLMAIIAGMGAVLTLDWLALRWLLGTLPLRSLLSAAAECHLVIWAGWTVLVLSGALLDPDLSSTLTRVKVGAVLVAGLNGLAAHAMQRRLEQAEAVGLRLLLGAGTVATVSQAAWWTAVVVGFLNVR